MEDTKVEYPKYVYHKKEGAKLVQSEAEHKALGKGYAETPFPEKSKAEQEEKKDE